MQSNVNAILVWAWQSNMMLIMLEVLGCTRGAVALLSITPLRTHLAAAAATTTYDDYYDDDDYYY